MQSSMARRRRVSNLHLLAPLAAAVMSLRARVAFHSRVRALAEDTPKNGPDTWALLQPPETPHAVAGTAIAMHREVWHASLPLSPLAVRPRRETTTPAPGSCPR